MKFGAVNPAHAEGGIVVHAVRHGAVVLKKGTVIGGADVAAMLAHRHQARHGGASRSRRCR